MKTGRSRISLTDVVVAGAGQTIALTWTAPFNCTLIQLSCKYWGVPGVADVFTVGKLSVFSPSIDPVFRSFAMGANGFNDVLCNETFELMRGDDLLVVASNDNDLEVGVEIILTEGG